jgi:hypothetical protein
MLFYKMCEVKWWLSNNDVLTLHVIGNMDLNH